MTIQKQVLLEFDFNKYLLESDVESFNNNSLSSPIGTFDNYPV